MPVHIAQNFIPINEKINDRLLNSTVRYVIGMLFFQMVKLEAFPVLKSNENHDLIFNRAVSWEDNVSIMASIYSESKNDALMKWFLLQCLMKHQL